MWGVSVSIFFPYELWIRVFFFLFRISFCVKGVKNAPYKKHLGKKVFTIVTMLRQENCMVRVLTSVLGTLFYQSNGSMFELFFSFYITEFNFSVLLNILFSFLLFIYFL